MFISCLHVRRTGKHLHFLNIPPIYLIQLDNGWAQWECCNCNSQVKNSARFLTCSVPQSTWSCLCSAIWTRFPPVRQTLHLKATQSCLWKARAWQSWMPSQKIRNLTQAPWNICPHSGRRTTGIAYLHKSNIKQSSSIEQQSISKVSK